MRNYVLRVRYLGDKLYGFQKQATVPTVQGEIEKALSLILRKSIRTNGAARTDRGVNALNQYVNFYFDEKLDTERLRRKLNSMLFNKWIYIKDFFETDLLFHPRKNVRGKIYSYILSDNRENAMFLLPRVYFYNGKTDFNLLKKAMDSLRGEHDFVNFANKDRSQPLKNTVCTIYDIGVIKKGSVQILYFYGNRFLYHMVRRLVYFLIKAGTGNVKKDFLENPFLENAPFTRQVLPPEPLFLVDVYYKNGIRRVNE